jgi:hypothetical protein
MTLYLFLLPLRQFSRFVQDTVFDRNFTDIVQMADQLQALKKNSPLALPAYLRNVRLGLYSAAKQAILEVRE